MAIPEYLLGFVLAASAIFTFGGLARHLRDVERRLNLVLAHLGIDPTAHISPSSHVISLAGDPKQRIAAIKAYRTQTGAGLKDAVAVVDGIAKGAGA